MPPRYYPSFRGPLPGCDNPIPHPIKYCAFCRPLSWKLNAAKISPERQAWKNIKQRCGNPRHPLFKYYGARNIQICEEWLNDFNAFFVAVGKRPKPGLWIERIDNSKGYEPGNVEWATPQKQNRNRRNNRWLTVDGVSKTVDEWSRANNISANTINRRIARGYPPDRAVFEVPLNRGRRVNRVMHLAKSCDTILL